MKMDKMHEWLSFACEAGNLLFEFIGVVILIWAGMVGIYNYIKKSPYIRLELAKGMALGLEFKMGGEILRTVGVTGWTEIAMVAGIIALRAALAFLIHWEIKTEQREFEALESQKHEDYDENNS